MSKSESVSIVRPVSRLVTPLLFFLVPATVVALAVFPVLVLLSFIPILGFFSLPTLLSLTLFLNYSVTWSLYLFFAQVDPPSNVRLPFLPLSPVRCFKVTYYSLRLARDAIAARAVHLFFDLQVRRVMVLGGKDAKNIVKENILYADHGKRLDVYFPERRRSSHFRSSTEERSTAGSESSFSSELSPTIVFIGGGNWSWWRKKMGAQTALRLRRLGYAVVVPDLSVWPGAKSPDMVRDLRRLLEWTAERIQTYGGDPAQIYLLGYGSGAHISLLTVVQDAVVRSRDEYITQCLSPVKVKSAASSTMGDIEISAGIRRCQIWGEDVRLPALAGMIFVSGVFDIIKQLRFEAKLGIEDLSSLRRACGPSTGATLLSCPSHLLFGAKELLDAERLPPKILIIAGGRDVDVPYSQSVLLRSLLVGVGAKGVRIKLYRDENHLGSLASLMHQTRYSPLFLDQIERLVASRED